MIVYIKKKAKVHITNFQKGDLLKGVHFKKPMYNDHASM